MDFEALYEELKPAVEHELKAAAKSAFKGAADDLKEFAGEMLKDSLAAMRLKDTAQRDAVIAELRGQVSALAELSRLRAVNDNWERSKRIMGVALSASIRIGGTALLAAV